MEKKSKRKRAIPARIKISNFVTVRIFPQKRLNALALEPGISPRNRKAKPNMVEKTIPVEVSGLNSPRSANGPTIADAIRLNRTAPKSGGKPAQRLNKAPLNAHGLYKSEKGQMHGYDKNTYNATSNARK
jgi:hypothetical protein